MENQFNASLPALWYFWPGQISQTLWRNDLVRCVRYNRRRLGHFSPCQKKAIEFTSLGNVVSLWVLRELSGNVVERRAGCWQWFCYCVYVNEITNSNNSRFIDHQWCLYWLVLPVGKREGRPVFKKNTRQKKNGGYKLATCNWTLCMVSPVI